MLLSKHRQSSLHILHALSAAHASTDRCRNPEQEEVDHDAVISVVEFQEKAFKKAETKAQKQERRNVQQEASPK